MSSVSEIRERGLDTECAVAWLRVLSPNSEAKVGVAVFGCEGCGRWALGERGDG